MKTKYSTNDLAKIVLGLNKAADIVKSTMGGQGKTVIIANNTNQDKLRFTKDGVSVAKSINFPDPLENIGAQILISAANKTVEQCGDATTLTSVLLQALVNETFKALNKSKGKLDINKMLSDIEYSVSEVINKLNEQSKKVTNTEEIKHIASTSANSTRVGDLFKTIYDQTGLDALLSVEKSESSASTYFEITNGIQFDNGYVHPSFMTNKDTEQAVYENAYIHVDEDAVSILTDEYQNLLSVAASEQVPLIIIAPRFSDSFIRTCSMNKVNQGTKVCLIKTPGYAYGQKKNIDDIKAFISKDGYVDKIVVTDRSFTLFNEDHNNLEERLDQLKSLSESAHDKYDEQDYMDRYYKLKTATAIIYAGGTTPEAMQEEYDRIEDAIGATKTAVQYGYVEGGGLALAKISLTSKIDKKVKNVIMAPMTQIIKNANVDQVNIDMENPLGYNVKTHTYENFLETGIIDPTNVIIVALLNALSNTKLLINTSYVLYNEYQNSLR
jgi:chaperonin GroEL